MFGRKRQQAPLHISVQTRDANPTGTLGFAYVSPYAVPNPWIGTGTIAGSYVQEAGQQLHQGQGFIDSQLGGLVTGVLAQQPLTDEDYVKGLAL